MNGRDAEDPGEGVVEFVEPHGRVVVFLDLAGNRWDLLGPS
ncbi:MAG: hypothetical protein ACREN5_06575 [Gemmatimonadales bacterium]